MLKGNYPSELLIVRSVENNLGQIKRRWGRSSSAGSSISEASQTELKRVWRLAAVKGRVFPWASFRWMGFTWRRESRQGRICGRVCGVILAPRNAEALEVKQEKAVNDENEYGRPLHPPGLSAMIKRLGHTQIIESCQRTRNVLLRGWLIGYDHQPLLRKSSMINLRPYFMT